MRIVIAWLGGLLFVVSLGAFGVLYGITLGEPAPDGTPVAPALLSDIVLFSLFALHHSLMARTGARRWIAGRLPAGLERSVFVWVASLLFIGVCWLWQPLPGYAWILDGPGAWIGRAAQLFGVWITLRSAAMLDPLELAGIRQVSGTERPVVFKVDGPYGLVRHPIYLGWLFLVFGAPVMTMSRLVMAVVSSAYLIAAIPWEEASLVEGFGDTYRAYQRQVPWRILPRLW